MPSQNAKMYGWRWIKTHPDDRLRADGGPSVLEFPRGSDRITERPILPNRTFTSSGLPRRRIRRAGVPIAELSRPHAREAVFPSGLPPRHMRARPIYGN